MFRASGFFNKAIVPAFALAFLAPVGIARAADFKFESLYAFKDINDSARPSAGLIADAAGNLYGTTGSGSSPKTHCGGIGCGTVYKIAPSGKETVLYAFGANAADGAIPLAPLIMDSAGNLYGTTFGGGSAEGTVFKVTPKGKETVLYTFQGGHSDGAEPHAGLVADAAGNFYGTTYIGGGSGCYNNQGCGVVFKLTPNGTETVLYSFCSQANCIDGASPEGSLIIDQAGNLYGTTTAGGASNDGTVFELASDGSETVLHSFAGGDDGNVPVAGLLMDAAGNLYGTTAIGGPSNWGTVFELAPDGTETVLHAFNSREKGDGAEPGFGALIMDSSGNLYGTTSLGGTGCKKEGGCGIVYEVAPNGTETVLYAFANRATGEEPLGGLLMDKSGDLFGTTGYGGNTCTGFPDPSYGCGTVFELTP